MKKSTLGEWSQNGKGERKLFECELFGYPGETPLLVGSLKVCMSVESLKCEG